MDAGLKRLIVPLADDGGVALDRLRPETRDKLAALLNNSRMRREFGGKEADESPLMPLLGPALVQALATLDLLLVQRLTKAPPALVAELAAWTPAERHAIEPAAVAVANKYGGSLLSKYGDEAALLVALASITSSKVMAIREALDRMAPAPPITPAPAPAPAASPADASAESVAS